ncbi:ABC transporter substrate-binding protein [Meiothermus granaticius]|uniref:Putative arabinose-binding protein n=1 Tax=Meiothermus granaticius NBRC 107808 TaxID=1227551 RepID=A0A399F5D3_9DEIN|nr:extracellular solute-binding protein [Meiothermus granaticius]MCL6528147.1 extracellular solute-binding protein [Thermaceae bacterium]RIH91280.1 putative arabinose-binding protein [Meiothermus granaticius NBRC 107808]GEM86237.1 ABC transporter substrate-binding protein [Meiothermus granaticius NBRC 107808]
MKKILPLLALLILASLAVAQKTTLTVAVFPNLDDSLKAQIPLFNKKFPDVEVKLVIQQYADHHNALTTALATGQGLPDVAAIEIGYVGRFAEGQGFEDLNKAPYSAGQYKKLFTPYTISQATSSDGRFIAMPTDIGPGTFFYRNDILQKAGVDPKSMMTWPGYIAAGRAIKSSTGSFLIADAADVAWINIFATTPANTSPYFDEQGKVVVDTPRFVRAFELAKNIRAAGLDARIGSWTNEWYDAFKKGTVATQFSGAWLMGHLKNWMAPDTKGLWRVQQLPEGMYASWGGSFYGIPSASKNKALAWEFIKFVTTNDESQIAGFKAIGAFPALLAAQNDPVFNDPVEFLGGQKAFLIWRDAARRVKPLKANKYDRVAYEILGTALSQVLDEGKDVTAALAEAKRLIERRMR